MEKEIKDALNFVIGAATTVLNDAKAKFEEAKTQIKNLVPEQKA